MIRNSETNIYKIENISNKKKENAQEKPVYNHWYVLKPRALESTSINLCPIATVAFSVLLQSILMDAG